MTSEAEIGYIAGLLEGEATFTYPPSIALEMTDYDVIEKAAIILGLDINRISKHKNHFNYKQRYVFTLCGRDAVNWMRIIRPYMGDRRGAKIDEIINKINSVKPFFELGEDFCAQKGHSIKYVWEYDISINGHKRCKRCYSKKVSAPIESNNDPNYVFINPFELKLSQGA